jgi:ArsR family transcriptional regulator
MDSLLAALRAAAEPTRLRLLALAARGTFCVVEFTEILGQSQPRLSRHLKLLCDAGLLERLREGVNAWFVLPSGAAGALVRELLAHLPTDDRQLVEDRRRAARVLAERARAASESFRKHGAAWDEMGALGLRAEAVEAALLGVVDDTIGRLLDIGAGTGRLLELLAPRAESAVGIDASREMVALARTRLSRAGLANCAVRLADMYRLPVADASVDFAVLQMVLHYAEDPAAVLAEAARVLRPGGRLLVVDLAAHARTDLVDRLAHCWAGFEESTVSAMLARAGLLADAAIKVAGPLDVLIWIGTRLPPQSETARADAPFMDALP